MVLTEVIKIGVRSIKANKLRSFLSVLGVVFGVAAVIAMLSIGEGARLEALEQIRLLGTNNILVRALPLNEKERLEAQRNLSLGLTLSDAHRIREVLSRAAVVSSVKALLGTARFEDREAHAHIVGVTPDYQTATGLPIALGRFLRAQDLESRNKVCVIGWKKWQDLFLSRDPIGKVIDIQGELYQVVGVLENRDLQKIKNLVVQVRDINNDIYIPLLEGFYPLSVSENVDEIIIHLNQVDQVLATAGLLRSILDRLHNNVKDFEIVIPRELLRQSQRTQRIFNIVMGSIASISLLVGGIGIMNIMLAVITERTREIGIRRAMGANRQDILRQFLVETMVLTITGGTLGILLGSVGAKIINYYVGWLTVVSIGSVFIAFFVSVLVGIIFGMYPAYKAAHMNPIEALRYE